MKHEEAIRQFTDQGYRVVVMGAVSQHEDFMREVHEALKHEAKTIILLPYDGGNVRIENGVAYIHEPRASMATMTHILAESIKLDTYNEDLKAELKQRKQYERARSLDHRHRSQHFKKL